MRLPKERFFQNKPKDQMLISAFEKYNLKVIYILDKLIQQDKKMKKDSSGIGSC